MSSSPSSMSNFQKVQEFNRLFGAKTHSTLQTNVFKEDPKLVDFRLSLITEEVKELQDAIKDNDIVEVRDALSDILYVVYGMQDALGIDGDADFDIVHSSNMTKLCSSEEEAQSTVSSYVNKFKEGKSTYDSPYYELVGEGIYAVKNKSTGKVLKNINYIPVDFTKLKID